MATDSSSDVASGVGCGDVVLFGEIVAIGLDAADELVAISAEGTGEASCERFARPQEVGKAIIRKMNNG